MADNIVAQEMAAGRDRVKESLGLESGRTVKTALESAKHLSAQQVGQNLRLSRQLNLPTSVVAAAPEVAQVNSKFQQISDDELFARWAKNSTENAALARDDTEGLGGAIRAAAEFPSRMAQDVVNWLAFDSGKDVTNMGRQLVHGAADFNRALVGAVQAPVEVITGKDSSASQFLQGVQERIDWGRSKTVKGNTWLGQLGYDFVRSIPQQLGNIMAAWSGNPAAALSLMGMQIGGGSYASLRDEGVSPERALASGVLNAVAQAPLEKTGIDRFLAIFKSTSVRDTIAKTLGAAAVEYITEFTQKAPELVTQLWGLAETQADDPVEQVSWFGRQLTDADVLMQAMKEGNYEGLIGAMWGGLGGGARGMALRYAEKGKAESFAAQNLALHEQVQASSTTREAPEYMEDALESASKILAQSVYIPAADAIALVEQGQDVLSPLGISMEQASRAAAEGVDLEVKLSALQTRLDAAGMAAVAQIMRENPEALNAAEAARVDSAAQAQAVVEEARQRQRKVDRVRQEEARLVREMDAVLHNKEAAVQYGALHAAQARAFEAAYGVDPAQLMQRRSVELGTLPDEGPLNQTAYHGSPHRFDYFSTENIGSGNGNQAHGWGLYFAKNREVAEDYRDELESYTLIKFYGNLYRKESYYFMNEEGAELEDGIDIEIANILLSEDNPIQVLKEKIQEIKDDADGEIDDEIQEEIDRYEDAISEINDGDMGRIDSSQVYKVEIPDDDVLLDEQYDFNDQPEKVKKILQEIAEEYSDIEEAIENNESGGEIYDILSSLKGGDRRASEFLKDKGIEGISYYSQRDGHCFVVFSDEAVDVLDTFYQHKKQEEARGAMGDAADVDDGPRIRAQVTLDSQTAAIAIFKGADLSAIPHESAHIFIDDLKRVSKDDGSIARARLQQDMTAAGIDATPYAALLDGTASLDDARATLRDVRAQLEELDTTATSLQAARKEISRKKEGKEARDALRTQLAEVTARRKELAPQESVLADFIRHWDGVTQAQADMRTLREFANVPLEGELTPDQWRDVQEYAARGFEQYLYEGKSPSAKLAGVFYRMSQWLKAIYRSLRQMGDYVQAELSDDVRRVYDRLLLADAQIQEDPSVSAALAQEADFLAEADLTAEEHAELESLRNRAEAEVSGKLDRAVARERNARFKKHFARAKEAAKEAPFWQFIAAMRETKKPEAKASKRKKPAPRKGGIDKQSLVEYLGDDMTAAVMKKMPLLVNAQGGGQSIDALAMEYNLTDGNAAALAELIYQTLVVEDLSVNKQARREAEKAMAEEDAQTPPAEGLLDGDAYGQYLDAVETAMLKLGRKEALAGEQAAARKLEKQRLPESYYKNLARQEVALLPVRELKDAKYIAALRRALADRSKAARAGKAVEAVRAVQRARMAFAMMQEVSKARMRAGKTETKLKKAARAKDGTYAEVQAEAIRRLVLALGLPAKAQPHSADLATDTFQELVTTAMGDTAAVDLMPIFSNWLLGLKNPDEQAQARGIGLNFLQLRPEEVQQVQDLLDFLMYSGREQNLADKRSEASRIKAIVDEAVSNMDALPEHYASRQKSFLRRISNGFSSIDTLDWQCRKADGFQSVPGRKDSTEGVLERNIYNILRDDMNRYHQRLADTQRGVTPHLITLLKSSKVWRKKYGSKMLNIRDEDGNIVPLPAELRRSGQKGWSPEIVVGMALNLANQGNRERLSHSLLDYDQVSLVLGDDAAALVFGLDAEQAERMQAGRNRRDGLLSAEDWQAVQGIWDVFGTQWEATQQAHKAMYGFAPAGIEYTPFALRVGDTIVQMAGGYYPIKYDPAISVEDATKQQKEDILDRSEGMFGVPAARKGHTMARVGHTGRPLLLDASALPRHLTDSARFIELGKDVRFADKVTRDSAFSSAYVRAFGMDDYKRIRPNLKALVVEETHEDVMGLIHYSEAARKKMVYYALGANFNTALMQLTAVFPAMHDIGTMDVVHGVAQTFTRGPALVREVFAASPYMERRYRNIDDDLSRKAMKFAPSEERTIIKGNRVYTWEDIANLSLMPIAVADLVVSTAAWSAAYNKKLRELRGGSGAWGIDKESAYHDEAVAYADKIISLSNPDNDALSRSAFGRDRGAIRFFNIFSGAITKFAQRTRYGVQGLRRGKVTPFEFGRMELADMIWPAMSMAVMGALMQGLFSGDDDDTEALKKLLLTQTLDQISMALPIAGNAAADWIAAALGASKGRRGGVSTPINTPYEIASRAGVAFEKWASGEDYGEKLVLSALDLGSFFTQLPVGPVTRKAMKGYEQWQQGEGTPFSMLKPR